MRIIPSAAAESSPCTAASLVMRIDRTVSGQLFQVAGIDVPPVYFPDHVSAERVAPAVDPVGHRTHPPRKGIRLRPGSAHHDGSRTAVAAVRERLHLRVGTALLRRDDNHAVPALFTVLGFRRSILEHRNRSDPGRATANRSISLRGRPPESADCRIFRPKGRFLRSE